MATPVDEKLLYASEHGNVDAIIEALAEGANPNCTETDEAYQTPLSYAAESGNPAAVQALLERGADITKSPLAFFMTEDDEILGLLVRANPHYVFKEFDAIDIIKGIEYETEKRNLEEAGYPDQAIRTDPELKRISRDIRFAQKIKKMARALRGGRRRSRRSRRSRREKRTYRRRTFKQ
jgi:hypothetical protein